MEKNNLILIGMPGCGKTTVGGELAKSLKYQFVDADRLIEEKMNMTLEQIISKYGIDKFHDIEGEINSSINGDHQIISTGGSIIYNAKAMEHYNKIGTIIYLNHTYEELKIRLGDLKKRGVTVKPGQTLYDLYLERTPLYEKYADVNVKIPFGKIPVKDTVNIVIDKLKENSINIYSLN